jgi:hypothetical protein
MLPGYNQEAFLFLVQIIVVAFFIIVLWTIPADFFHVLLFLWLGNTSGREWYRTTISGFSVPRIDRLCYPTMCRSVVNSKLILPTFDHLINDLRVVKKL